MSAKQKIFLVDDHPAMLDGLRGLILRSEAWVVCGEARTAAQAAERIPDLNPDLVVVDVSLPDKNGIELVEELQGKWYGLNFLIFSMHDEAAYAERALRAGAKGFLSKCSGSMEFGQAVQRILAGGVYLSPEISRHLAKRFRKIFPKAGLARMTDLDWRIFDEIGRGRTNSEIGALLDMPARQVDSHRIEIRGKLGLEDSQGLVREAMLWSEVRQCGFLLQPVVE